MKLQKAVFVLMGVMMLLFADKLSAQQVKTDYDRSASFGQYKTYSWEQVKTKDALDVGRIKAAVNAALAAKGWTQVDSGGDVSIIAVEMTQDKQTLNTFYDGFGGGWGWRRFGGGGFGDATTTTETYKVGTFVAGAPDIGSWKCDRVLLRTPSGETTITDTTKSKRNMLRASRPPESAYLKETPYQ
jgi:hypothetical protein